MEVMYALTSMRQELGVEKRVPSANQGVDSPLKFIFPPIEMEIRSIVKSLAVKSTLPRWRKIIDGLDGAAHFIADKGYDAEAIRQSADGAGISPAISRKANSKKGNPEFDAYPLSAPPFA